MMTSVTHHISGTVHHLIIIFVHICKMMISPGVFFIFSKFLVFGLLGAYKGNTITFTLCVGKVKFSLLLFSLQSFELAMQDSHPRLYSTKTLYHFYISDSFW